jgi:hypothetical protein
MHAIARALQNMRHLLVRQATRADKQAQNVSNLQKNRVLRDNQHVRKLRDEHCDGTRLFSNLERF